MNINIKATNIEITPAIREYVHEKISALEKIIENIDDLNVFVEIGRESHHHQKGEDVFLAELRMRLLGNDYYFKNTHADLYAALDAVKDEALRDVNRDKKRGQTLFIRGARSLKKRIKGMKPWWPFGDRT